MPYDYFDYGVPEGTFGNDDQYSGDTPEEFYDYLMTPRQHKKWSGSGAIKHYGPDRYASISPEDAAMADILMKQMEQERQFEYQEGVRKSEMGRRQAADELMMPQGRGGGKMTFQREGRPWDRVEIGGGMPTGPPKPRGPMDERERMMAVGGGFGESRVEAAKQNQYGRPRQSSPPTQSQVVNARAELESTTMDLMNAASFDEAWANLTPEQMVDRARKDRQNIPATIVETLAPWMEANLKWNAYSRGGGPQGPREDWRPGGGG